MGGGQGQDLRRREPVLIGEDGVDSGRAEEHLQGKGEAGGRPVIVIFPNNINLFCMQRTEILIATAVKRDRLRLIIDASLLPCRCSLSQYRFLCGFSNDMVTNTTNMRM